MPLQGKTNGWIRFRAGCVFLVFVAIAAFFLWEEHRAHLLGYWPYLLLILCPLMHLFMHGGHGGRGGGHGEHHGDKSGGGDND